MDDLDWLDYIMNFGIIMYAVDGDWRDCISGYQASRQTQ